jgi:hypothetical protein
MIFAGSCNGRVLAGAGRQGAGDLPSEGSARRYLVDVAEWAAELASEEIKTLNSGSSAPHRT